MPDVAQPTVPAPAAKAPPPSDDNRVVRPGGAAVRSRESVWGLRKPLPAAWRLPLSLSLPLLIVIVWCTLTLGHKPMIHALFLPSPVAVLRALLRLAFNGDLWPAILASSTRIAVSFGVAAGVALPLGILMGAFEPINRAFESVMAPLRYMPISAFIPLLILWLGIGESQKIAFLFLGVFVYLLPVVVTAIRAVPEELVQTALTLGATRRQAMWTVLIPAALPDIFDSFRVMNAISWTYVILAEIVNARQGLGAIIQIAGEHTHTDEVFAGILVIGVIGLLTDVLIRTFNNYVFAWREQGTET